MLGVGTLFYGLVTVTEFFVSGHLANLLSERRAQRMIDATSDHSIICGYGRVGRQVARDLRAAGARYSFIVGVRAPDRTFTAQPPTERVLVAGDMALGTTRTMERLEALFEQPGA